MRKPHPDREPRTSAKPVAGEQLPAPPFAALEQYPLTRMRRDDMATEDDALAGNRARI
jgi:hypothetical protein